MLHLNSQTKNIVDQNILTFVKTGVENPIVSPGKNIDGLAWYSNTTTAKPLADHKNMIPSKLQIEGIDYLQFFGKFQKPKRVFRFEFIEVDQPTRMFKKTVFIEDKRLNKKICVMNYEPVSKVLKNGSCMLKFDNEVLYSGFFTFKYLQSLFKSIGFQYQYIKRLDIYRDFQTFKSCLPEDLIRKFFRRDLLPIQRAKFNSIGKSSQDDMNFQYLRFGKKNSGKQVYLYNKSQELKDVGNKEHIVRTWMDQQFNPNVDVWRLEFSFCREKRNRLLDKETGELLKIDLKKIFTCKYRNELYNAALYDMFRFVINPYEGTDKKIRKSRAKPFPLFDNKKVHVKISEDITNVDKFRTKKIIIKELIINILDNSEVREHKTTSIDRQIEAIEKIVAQNLMYRQLARIIEKIAYKRNLIPYTDLEEFIYNSVNQYEPEYAENIDDIMYVFSNDKTPCDNIMRRPFDDKVLSENRDFDKVEKVF